jgi:choline dehydrogenase-like flavoprotein
MANRILPNHFSNLAFLNRARILFLRTNQLNTNEILETPIDKEEPLAFNEYDYIILGTGAGAAGVLLSLLKNGTGNEKILVIEQGNANTFNFDKNVNNGFGQVNFEDGATLRSLENINVRTVDTQPEEIFDLNNNSIGEKVYPILLGNVLGGNTTNNLGYWHHQPISTIADFPPNNLNNFDINKWKKATIETTQNLTSVNREDYFNGAIHINRTLVTFRNILRNSITYLNNLFSDSYYFSRQKILNFFKYHINVPFSDVNLERGQTKLATTTFFFNKESGLLGLVPPILRIFNDYNILYNSTLDEFSNENVRVILNSEVKKLLVNDFTEVYGVQLVNGTEYRSRHKVFISCGAFQTPRLLAKSNLGPQKWYNENNKSILSRKKLNPELDERIENGNFTLWQTPDFSSKIIIINLFGDLLDSCRQFGKDGTNINDQCLFVANNGITKFGPLSIPNLWYALWEGIRFNPLIGLKGKDLKEDFLLLLEFLSNNILLTFNLNTKPYMIKNNYSEEDINKVEQGITNLNIINIAFTGISSLVQYRVNFNKDEYPGGFIAFRNENFDIKDIKADFGWSTLQTNKSFLEAVREHIRNIKNDLLTNIFKSDLGFRSFRDIIDAAISSGDYNNLTTILMLNYTSKDGIATIYDEPYRFTNDNNEEIEIYVEENCRVNEDEINEKAQFFGMGSGWHYTGTCSDLSNRDTGELLPGCMIADGSAFNGPVKNNSMASIAAIGYYMAEMAINQKEEKLCKCKPDVMYSEMY